MSIKSLRIWLVLAVLLFTASCVSMNYCAYDTKTRPDPISLSAEEGVFFGTNYTACFLIDGVVYKEFIPECAYKYYHNKRNRY